MYPRLDGLMPQRPFQQQQQQQQQQSQPQPQQQQQTGLLLSQQLQAAAAVAAAVNQQQQQKQGDPKNANTASVSGSSRTSNSNTPLTPTAITAQPTNGHEGKALNDEKVYSWIIELAYGPNKEQALLELGKKREYYDDLALVLWNSFGVMTSLLEEIIAVYPYLSPPNLTTPASNRVCNALALLQCVASHPDTRTAFLNAQIPLFLYPFLNTNSQQRPFEYLRLTSLGVIGALVKNDTPEVIQFLLTTEIIPLCLKIMESSSELSKTVAIFIVQKILMDESGLAYVCQTYDRFEAVSNVLKLMIDQLAANPTARLLRHVIRCYLRLADNPDARVALKERLPQALKDGTFDAVLAEDAASKSNLSQLVYATTN
ncbi:DEKNAAC103417 [Brettanomyces naardenensis]|uniref:DEKNAAC103417 n=1 Tax=Brettanomyces naardenensis TaxID=13370 RepID=A0A448YNE6_BRENA|nr:DEKNAAC103417 [Brettanomyces naardenensis]